MADSPRLMRAFEFIHQLMINLRLPPGAARVKYSALDEMKSAAAALCCVAVSIDAHWLYNERSGGQ
jgi:hypothetical protein